MATSHRNNIKDITTTDFLEFLKITCQVNESIHNKDKPTAQEIDYNRLANNEMINNLLFPNQKSTKQSSDSNESTDDILNNTDSSRYDSVRSKSSNSSSIQLLRKSKSETFESKTIHPVLRNKLEEVIGEGILDSVLPFICPTNTSGTLSSHSSNLSQRANKSAITNNTYKSLCFQEQEKKDTPSESSLKSKSPRSSASINTIKGKDSKSSRRKSATNINSAGDEKKSDIDVIIHVCDEVKNTSKDFSCPQYLLVSKMGYFADVTAGQKLEDMDISVHCDIQIFDWLMKWVKKDQNNSDSCPQLDALNVVPILVSASFLQMEPLLLDCLSFCHSRLSEVVRASTNLSCLNDSIITRLAAMFTNIELEMVKDKKERVTPRLWSKMIQSLFEQEPQALRGHYFSLIGLYRCSKCGKYLTQSVSSYVTCIPTNTRINRWGQLISQHSRDTSWQVTNYVSLLFKELKSWRRVYWKLWGHCHFLYCCICESHFPAYQMNWCQYHPETPQFLGPITEGRIAGPAGRYACCGQQAFRYETLPGPNGCQFREHSAVIETDRDRAIVTLAQIAADGNCLYEAPPAKPVTYANNEPRWAGMSLMPTKCRQGLLPPLNTDEYQKLNRRMRQSTFVVESSSETESSENDKRCIPRQFSTSSDGCESDPSSPRRYSRKSHRRQTKTNGGRYWSGDTSARSNQDNQREFEERVMKQIIAMVSKKTGNDANISYNNYQNGGTYVKLEAEWKEQIKQKTFNKQKLK